MNQRLRQAAGHLIRQSIVAIVLLTIVISLGAMTMRERYRQDRDLSGDTRSSPEAIALRTKLKARQSDLDHLRQLTPASSHIDDIVTAIEQEAQKRRVVAEVIDIVPLETRPRRGTPQPSPSPLRDSLVDIRLSIAASGQPTDLLSLLHALEHLPYLTRLVTWQVSTVAPAGGPAVTGQAPDSAALPSAGQMTADIVITLRYEP